MTTQVMTAKNIIATIAIVLTTLISTPVFSGAPTGSEYLDGGANEVGLILCHGRGKHPTWKVVDPLRKGVNEQLGYHTLSLQMPNDDKSWEEYAEDFPEAYSRIKAAIRFLKDKKGVRKIFLMGHSMGSRMAGAFLSDNSEQPVNGLILAGCRNNGDYPFDCMENIKNLSLPILDIWGGGNEKDTDAASDRQSLQSKTYTQVEIPGANHKFDGYEDEFVTAVVNWLKKQ